MVTARASESDLHGLLHPVQKRARTQLSCTACRAGKLKCNRGTPCDQCLKRAKDDSCHYLAPPVKKKPNQNMKDRVKSLEKLVIQLIQKQPDSPCSAPSPSDSFASGETSSSAPDRLPAQSRAPVGPAGTLQISKKETTYASAAHWASILDDIAEVKANLEGEDESSSEEEDYDSAETNRPVDPASSVLLGVVNPCSREDLIAFLPSKDQADKIIDFWLSTADPLTIAIHKPSFMRQYHKFWLDSSKTPLMWIALLFTIIAMGARMMYISDSSESMEAQAAGSLVSEYLMCAAHALCMGDFTKPKEYTLEALWLFTFSDIFRMGNFSTRTWLLCSVLLRIAVRMGYHRDPDHYVQYITPFQAEMRRRLWLLVTHLDSLSSFQLGLPNMLTSIQHDVKAPRNLLDTDFDEDTTEFPPSRPLSEVTPVVYALNKSKICQVFAAAAQISFMGLDEDYSRVIAMDRHLTAILQEVPEALQARTYIGNKATSESEPLTASNMAICAFNLTIMYHKSRCIIHRRFLQASWKAPQYEYSRKAAVESALELLEYHYIIQKECEPGGCLWQCPWYAWTLSSADFLLAAMILCLHLSCYVNFWKRQPKDHQTGGMTCISKDELNKIVSSLQRSCDIFAKQRGQMEHSKRATCVVQGMIDKAKPLIDSLEPDLTNCKEMSKVSSQSMCGDETTSAVNCATRFSDFEQNQFLIKDYIPSKFQDIHLNATDPNRPSFCQLGVSDFEPTRPFLSNPAGGFGHLPQFGFPLPHPSVFSFTSSSPFTFPHGPPSLSLDSFDSLACNISTDIMEMIQTEAQAGINQPPPMDSQFGTPPLVREFAAQLPGTCTFPSASNTISSAFETNPCNAISSCDGTGHTPATSTLQSQPASSGVTIYDNQPSSHSHHHHQHYDPQQHQPQHQQQQQQQSLQAQPQSQHGLQQSVIDFSQMHDLSQLIDIPDVDWHMWDNFVFRDQHAGATDSRGALLTNFERIGNAIEPPLPLQQQQQQQQRQRQQ